MAAVHQNSLTVTPKFTQHALKRRIVTHKDFHLCISILRMPKALSTFDIFFLSSANLIPPNQVTQPTQKGPIRLLKTVGMLTLFLRDLLAPGFTIGTKSLLVAHLERTPRVPLLLPRTQSNKQ